MTKSTLSMITPCSVGMKFATAVNNTSGEDYMVELNPNVCCLESNDDNCDIIILTGADIGVVPQGTIKTFYLVAPIIDPYGRKGQCTAYLDYRSESDRNIKREIVKIHFDTTIKKTNADNLQKCRNIDEDPLNDCKPVICEEHYNGKRVFYNKKLKRCVDTPECVDSVNFEVPKVIYDPSSNKCTSGDSVSEDDIEFIKSITKNGRKAKNIMIIENVLVRNSMANNNSDRHDRIRSKITKVNATKITAFSLMRCLKSNSYTMTILSIVILIQCCLICTMIYCMSKSCGCGRKKTVIRKFFNYRQDVSVTTPLIGTSNMDTDTTDNQYLSESSNIDNKIKCYKACQKERKNNVKLSMSDDILLKCLNRRDWHRMPKSETIPEVNNEEVERIEVPNPMNVYEKTDTELKAEPPTIRDNFEHSKDKMKSFVKSSNEGFINVVSEREIQCHTYNIADQSQYNDNFKTSDAEKGAQAYFSNDSMDEFLSERGLIYIGENPSKYSFTSVSSDGKSTSSRTSKNNIVKNVISLFSRKSKSRLSDPGLKTSKAELDLELIHMSHASVSSSSNNQYVKSLKRLQDSRSSL